MAQSSEDVPVMLGGGSTLAVPAPVRKAAAQRLAELAVLLLRVAAVLVLLALAVFLLLSPVFAAALLLG